MKATNEAAEDLRMLLLDFQPPTGQMARRAVVQVLDQALANERRGVVERLRDALHVDNWDPAVSEIPGREERIYAVVVKRALDEEADR